MIKQFLQTVVTTDSGYFLLATRNGKSWEEFWYEWPNDIDAIEQHAHRAREHANVYFSAHLFRTKRSIKENVLPSRTIQADLDHALLEKVPVVPTVVVETSSGRHQAYLVLSEDVSLESLEEVSKRFTYSIPECDRSGWSLGHRMRLPDTNNYKYALRQEVLVKSNTYKTYNPNDLELLHSVPQSLLRIYDEEFLDEQEDVGIGPNELLETIREKIPPSTYTQYNIRLTDRSRYLWSLMCSAFRAGLNRHQVFHLAKNSANNKFDDLRYHADRELAKDVQRAEETVLSKDVDTRSLIMGLRKQTFGLVVERRQAIAQAVLDQMKREGEFIRTKDDEIWYIRRDLGRPIMIAQRSEYLRMIMDLEYGLNATEQEYQFTVAAIIAYVKSLTPSGLKAAISYYNPDMKAMYIHTGRKTIVRITPDDVTSVNNGENGIIFPWAMTSSPFMPDLTGNEHWSDLLIGHSVDNVIEMEPEEARAIIMTWTMFTLFRNIAMARPILALFGQPGAGKSTILKKVYALMYGEGRQVGSITDPDNFDSAVSSDPLVVLDNADSYYGWLPDRLALSAGSSDIIKRKLYTDNDTIIQRRQAIVAITAHNPRFGREDVLDRMLVMNFRRLGYFGSEGEIIGNVIRNRNRIWGSIIKDIQTIIRIPFPTHHEAPQFRVEDFAQIGLWIARGLNIEAAFRSAMTNIKQQQSIFVLDEDSVLVEALKKFVDRGNAQFYSPSILFTQLPLLSGDAQAFIKKYGTVKQLGMKLWVMQESLKAIFDVEWKFDSNKVARVWRFAKRGAENQANTSTN